MTVSPCVVGNRSRRVSSWAKLDAGPTNPARAAIKPIRRGMTDLGEECEPPRGARGGEKLVYGESYEPLSADGLSPVVGRPARRGPGAGEDVEHARPVRPRRVEEIPPADDDVIPIRRVLHQEVVRRRG